MLARSLKDARDRKGTWRQALERLKVHRPLGLPSPRSQGPHGQGCLEELVQVSAVALEVFMQLCKPEPPREREIEGQRSISREAQGFFKCSCRCQAFKFCFPQVRDVTSL